MESSSRQAKAPTLPTVRDIMWELPDDRVVVFRQDTPLLEGVRALVRRRVSVAFVVDADDSLVGQLTDADCLRTLASSAYDNQPPGAACGGSGRGGVVDQAMDHVPICLFPEQDIFHATREFLAAGTHALPVVRDRRLVGCLIRLGLLSVVERIIDECAIPLRAQREETDPLERPSSIERLQRLFARLTPEQLVRVMRRTGHEQ